MWLILQDVIFIFTIRVHYFGREHTVAVYSRNDVRSRWQNYTNQSLLAGLSNMQVTWLNRSAIIKKQLCRNMGMR